MSSAPNPTVPQPTEAPPPGARCTQCLEFVATRERPFWVRLVNGYAHPRCLPSEAWR